MDCFKEEKYVGNPQCLTHQQSRAEISCGVSKPSLGCNGWINWEYTTTIPNYNTTIIGVVYINTTVHIWE